MVVRRAHRFAGVTGLLLFVLLAVTGIALNHSDALGLADTHVEAPWLLRWYGREAEPLRQGYPLAGQWLTAAGEHLYLDQRTLEADIKQLVGAVVSGPMRVVAADTGLWLFTDDGELIEHLGSGSAANVKAIGTADDGRVVVETPDGLLQADVDLVGWHAWQGKVRWSAPQELPSSLAEALTRQHFGEGPSWERVLLDLHSGRLLHIPGWLPAWLLADLAGVLLLLLSFSGLWVWLRHRRALAAHRRLHLRRPPR